MNMYLHAKGSGKTIRVVDRLAGTQPFEGWLDADQSASVDVGSSDGKTGNIDVVARMSASSAWVNVQTDYTVQADEVLDVDDV